MFTNLDPQALMLLDEHLNGSHEPLIGVRRNSSLLAAYNDARGATHRDRKTGAYEDDDAAAHSASWLGVIGYLAIIDQIGCCFGLAGANPTGRNEFLRGLELFSDVSALDAEALYALRNGLMHGYRLAGRSNSLKRDYRFALVNDADASLVTEIDFEGQPRTQINLRAVGDLAERMLEQLRKELDGARLQMAAGMDIHEFVELYGFVIKP